MADNGFSLFGFEIRKSEKTKKEEQKRQSFVVPTNDDGSVTVETSGAIGSYIDLDGTIKDEFHLITRYRGMALYPDVDTAIDDIVNESIVMEENEPTVTLDLAKVTAPGITDKVKDKIKEEFKTICRLLDFDNDAYEIFRKWYVDGRIYYHIILEDGKESEGIKELRYIDPRQIRKIRVADKQTDPRTGVELVTILEEYFVYNSKGIQSNAGGGMVPYITDPSQAVQGIRIEPDSIAFAHSGIVDKFSRVVLSHLHKAIKAYNQLYMMEDAVVIYRIARAPERRIFYIDVGNLPKHKAEQYLKSQMNNFRNKMIYDVNTGELRDDKRHLSMLEDFWLPRREGSQGTQIDTLRGGENLGEIKDLEYFQQKLYKALNVPVSRMEPESGFVLGRSTEITRDEVKFTKFIHRLRLKFSLLFRELLETQLKLKKIITEDDWEKIKDDIFFDFADDNHFTELKHSEILKDRIELLDRIDAYVGRYFSEEWVRENVLHQTEDEVKEIQGQINKNDDNEDMEFVPMAGNARAVRVPSADAQNFVANPADEEPNIKPTEKPKDSGENQ